MTVLYFGTYDYSYARNWVLINGLRANGVKVIELRCGPGRLSFLKLLFAYLNLKDKFDIMVVGFPGQEIMFLAKFLTKKTIIFDAFTSHYGGYILDRKKWKVNSWRAKYFRFLDRWSCKMADIVLLDTNAHIKFFVKEFQLPREKFRRIWIGANDSNFRPVEESQKLYNNKFNIIFFGTYVPLQGAEYIVRAAKILESHWDIVFCFVGKGQDKVRSMRLAEELGLKNIEFIGMMKPEDLRQKIANSDLVLGVFGNTPKTPLVIPNKIYEALAMKRPVITADTEAIRELFSENDIYLVKPADPNDLARSIIKLKNDPSLRASLANSGYNKFKINASHKVLGAKLLEILHELKT